jgi:hypothetical protein
MNNVDNPINLVYYLAREQYGDAPLLYGPHFAANYRDDNGDRKIDMKKGAMRYIKGKDKYIPTGRDEKPLYEKSDMQVFPRVWDGTNDQGHAEFYAAWLGLKDETGEYTPPSYADNFEWFFTYQMGLETGSRVSHSWIISDWAINPNFRTASERVKRTTNSTCCHLFWAL